MASSIAAWAGATAVLGQIQGETGDFPPRAARYPLADVGGTPYRIVFSLSDVPTDKNWIVRVESGAQRLTVSDSSTPASDGTYLSPLLDPNGASIIVPVGAPKLRVNRTIRAVNFGHALSVYPDTPGKAFLSVAEVVRTRSPPRLNVPRLARAARGMGWMAIENVQTGTFEGCTVFLIGRSLMLTARHCFPATISPDVHARVWLRDVVATRDAPPTADRVDVVWQTSGASGPGSLDAVVLRMPRSVDADLVLKLAPADDIAAGDITILQFPGSQELSLAGNSRCVIDRAPRGAAMAMHSCNSDGGSSGSPVLQSSMESGVIALHIAGFVNDPGDLSRAIPIAAVLQRIKDTDPSLHNEINAEQEIVKW